MASFNLTVEDGSPMISYAPAGSWNDTPSSDTLVASYSGRSYHIASAQGATASFNFNGTGFSIFGGRRPNYGTYSISVDGQIIHSGSSQPTNPTFKQLLGSATGLSDGPHTVTFTNTGNGPVDIDWIDRESRVGVPGATVHQKTFDDTDSAISYLPSPSSWQINTRDIFMGGTLHFSNDPSASAQISFSGDAVAIYGTVAPDHANIRVAVDGASQILPGGAQGKVSSLHTKVLLYYGSALGSGQHILSLSGDSQANTGPFIDIDSITVFEAVNNGSGAALLPTSTGSVVGAGDILPTNPTSQAKSRSAKTSTGTIVGVVAGVILGLILVLGIIGLIYVRKRRGKARKIEKAMLSVSPILPMQWEPKTLEAGFMSPPISGGESTVFPLPPPTSKVSRASMRHPIAPSYYSNPYYSHSRDGSITSSPTPSTVPLLSSPRSPPPRALTRNPTPSLDVDVVNKTPTRPRNRPPPIDFVIAE